MSCLKILITAFTHGSNPHPVRKLGAIRRTKKLQKYYGVPILTQSENWALSRSMSNQTVALIVPILTQSENWALLRMLYGLKPSKGVPILTQSENWALYY